MSNSKTKHTPGPWMVAQVIERSDMHIKDPNGEDVCKVYLQSGESTARLVAAAPELLKALRLGLYELKIRHELVGDVTEKMEQAIAKATGGAE